MSTTEPPFVLCGPTGTLVADGVQACYTDIAAAQTALRTAAVPIVLGALAFDVDSPAALMTPRSVRRMAGLPDWPTDPLPAVDVAGAVPAPEEHRARVRRACEQLTAPGNTLQKVVLARALRLAAKAPLDARVIL
ncbi:MAG: isochorismate synthase, partial [Mycobacterium sp.]|nr:isochorismate synthase [Mycobacterium sp.]